MSTKDRILNAAEHLFCDFGFDNTSLRAITSEADVNLASVNYHFGSKKQLIQEVLARYLSVLMPALDQRIMAMSQSTQAASTEGLFSALVEPLLSLEKVRPNGTRVFVQLFARAYYESQGHLRRYITTHYTQELKHLNKALHLAVPHLSPSEVFWRWHFALGSCVFTMVSSKALSEIAEAEYQQHMEIEDLIRKVITYIAAGFSAPKTS
ncbi:TetR/AcrR family transcriptional regulator [Planctobacterium marinum]|uniref:TetR/AcrR family transcriptional regulator n=1 Tax=Planctobacterium marinum TaxID=1631968 RepID=UPI001E604474|nr:TetR/AcrR family transcriptional regulator [Planctobacterium marinum]MCC2604183.1 TetR family transcriptional regulator [Planctobacterium marinum]